MGIIFLSLIHAIMNNFFKFEIPKNLSDNQKRLLKEFNEELSQKNNPESTGFFTKVKDFWDGLT